MERRLPERDSMVVDAAHAPAMIAARRDSRVAVWTAGLAMRRQGTNISDAIARR